MPETPIDLRDNTAGRRSLPVILALAAALVTLAVYLPTLGNDIVNWDDPVFISNINIQHLDLKFFKWAFTSVVLSNWHPLTLISHAIDYAVWGPNPLGHHLTSVVLHGINTLLVALVAFGLTARGGLGRLGPGGIATGIVAALLFGLHPLHVESVAWIAERKDVLSALFFLLSLLAYLKYTSGDADDSQKKCGYVASLVLFALALMSKPMAISLPFVLLIIDYYPLKRIGALKNILIEKLPFFALSAISGVITLMAQNKSGAIRSIELIAPVERVAMAIRGYAFYLYKTVLPLKLAPIYPLPWDGELFNVWFFISSLLLIAITCFCIYMAVNSKKRRPVFLAAWLYYLITLGPVIGLVQVGVQAAADRYMYLPSLGPFILVALGAGLLFEKRVRSAVIVVMVIISVFLAYRTVRQTGVWKDSLTLWSHEISIYPDRVTIAYAGRGTILQRRGDFKRAIEDFDKAIEIRPEYAEAYAGRGAALYNLGDFERAIEDFDKAIELRPSNAETYANRGAALQKQGDFKEAIADFDKAIELRPEYAEAYANREAALQKRGGLKQTITDFDKAIELDPEYAQAYADRGAALQKQGDFEQAIADFNKAIELDPVKAAFYYDRGLTYAMSRRIEPAIKDFTKAIELKPDFKKAYYDRSIGYSIVGLHEKTIEDLSVAIELDPWFVYAYHNRGIAHANLGKFKLAIEDITKAISLNPKDAEFYRNRALAYSRIGRTDLAAKDYETAAGLK